MQNLRDYPYSEEIAHGISTMNIHGGHRREVFTAANFGATKDKFPSLMYQDCGSTKYNGIVSRWMRTHGFFQTDNNESIFGHASQVRWKDDRKKITLRPGMEVSFRVTKGSNGKAEAFEISARGGEALDFHEKYGESDPYDRDVQYEGRIFRGTVKFFDSRQLYGKVILKDKLEEDVKNSRLKREDIFFKAVDALGEDYPFKIRRGRDCTFKLYYSDKYGWGAFDVMDGNQQPWPSYKQSKPLKKRKYGKRA